MGSSVAQNNVSYPSLVDDGDNVAEQVDNVLRFTGAEPLE
jgi:hypothetical protein